MSNSMVLLQKLGISTNSSLTYSEQSNAFLSQGYTSQAGNTYFNTLRLMEGILIKEDVGEGYRYTFLNGIKLYDISKNLLCERSYHCQVYGKSFIASEIKKMIKNLLFESCKKDNISIDANEVESHINKIVDNALNNDQRVIFNDFSQRYLTA